MKPILCVIDFSTASVNVLQTASSFAEETSTSLSILLPFRLVSKDKKYDVLKLKASLYDQAVKWFSFLEEPLIQKHISYEVHIEVGFISDRVKAHVESGNVSLIVIGSQQVKGISFDQGDDLKQLIDQLNIPLLIVPDSSVPIAA
ncbi:universal stress protein [Chryseosolibacter indicus]|uniref:Universal stress protein n=1 Tax=Chryseosolibacter indicus TaxID=2782351 RepID=A0ABS5VVK1_9BACT|nr:universal stress protein [Chryseosolibacter indicus]MBT1704749.1 universal stress protein [Chryseosolibacter indicus]